ncbi:MAG: hypothetical protein IPI49_33160 [Myxococcales bacterium]|nr:hypothetical protein [Myxococcales bacterium]
MSTPMTEVAEISAGAGLDLVTQPAMKDRQQRQHKVGLAQAGPLVVDADEDVSDLLVRSLSFADLDHREPNFSIAAAARLCSTASSVGRSRLARLEPREHLASDLLQVSCHRSQHCDIGRYSGSFRIAASGRRSGRREAERRS